MAQTKTYQLKKAAELTAAVKRAKESLLNSPINFSDPGVLQAFLSRTTVVSKQYGRQLWYPQDLQARPVSEPGMHYPRLHPVTAESPRIFISYGWSTDNGWENYEPDLWVDEFASQLFHLGYDIYFDRDPRNIEKLVDWITIIRRMNDCNYFVPILTDSYIKRLNNPGSAGPLIVEWKNALMLHPEFISFIGIRLSSLPLPKPLTTKTVLDLRKDPIARSKAIEAIFPRGGRPAIPPPNRPPDPDYWPKYIPY